MNRLAISIISSLVITSGTVSAQNAQTIYKLVDESGRVTYANSPMKGGTKLELDPLTVIQSPTTVTPSAPSAGVRTIPVAKVTSVPSPSATASASPSASYSALAAPVSFNPAPIAASPLPSATASATAPSPSTVAALETNDKVQDRAQQRRADIRQRILKSELQAAEKSLEGARTALADEQKRSNEIRTLRASFSATAETATAKRPLISAENRAEIERHFERVRNLQDEIAMHEDTVAALREEMVAKK